MRYEFKVRPMLQPHPSWIEVWGDQVIASSKTFEFMIGHTRAWALHWIDSHSWFGVTIRESRVSEVQKAYRLWAYAEALRR